MPEPLFKGVVTALVTPFRDGAVDEDAFVRLVERQVAAGVDGVGAGGPPGGAAPHGASLAGGGLDLSVIGASLRTEAMVMALSDTFLIIGAMVVGMMLILLVLPERTYPPRIVFAPRPSRD